MAFDSNIVVYNPSSDPLVNFNFMLRVELAIDVPCKSVRAFTRELEFDQIQEGGLNDYVHMRRKPISKPFTLEVERYVGTDYFDPLPLGTDFVLPVLLFVSRAPAQFIPGITARTYVFHGCTVIKKTYGDLVSDQAGILTETVTLAYREMLCVDMPWSKAADDVLAPDRTQAHSAKTRSTAPGELKKLGQDLYNEAKQEKDKADKLFVETDVAALITALKTLETDVKAAVDEKTSGWLLQAESDAENTLNGTGTIPPKPLFDAVNDLKAEVLEKKAALREAEKELRLQQDTYDREQKNRERKQKAATERLLNYKDQKKRAEEEIKELEKKLSDQTLTLENAKKARDTAKTKHMEAQEKLRSARRACGEEREALEDELKLAEGKRESVESALERAKDALKKETAECQQAEAAATKASQEAEAAKAELEKAEKALTAAQEALEKAEESEDGTDAAQQALTAAQEKLKQAETAKEEAQTACDEAGKAKEKAEKERDAAKQQLENAESEVPDLEAELKEAQSAEQEIRTALETPAEGSALKTSQDAAEAAQTECDEAKTALDKAEQDALVLPKIKALEKSIEGLDARIEEAKADGAVDPDEQTDSSETADSDAASGEESAETAKPKTPLEEATEKYEAAKTELQEKETELQKAQQKAADAQKELAEAAENVKKGKQYANALTNAINNLELRKTSIQDVRSKYDASVEDCSASNTFLQVCDENDTSTHNMIRTKYQEVKKHHDDAIVQTKKAGEADSYYKNSDKLKTQVAEWWDPLKTQKPQETT